MYRLLIADDHPLFRDAISRTLSLSVADASAAPYELLQAASLAETLSLIDVHADSLDLLLLDLDLPDSHGLEGLRRLRQEADWLPVAILSAHEARETVLEALSLARWATSPSRARRRYCARRSRACWQGKSTCLPS